MISYLFKKKRYQIDLGSKKIKKEKSSNEEQKKKENEIKKLDEEESNDFHSNKELYLIKKNSNSDEIEEFDLSDNLLRSFKPSDFNNLNNQDLKDLLKNRNIPLKGSKEDRILKLKNFLLIPDSNLKIKTKE